MSQLKTATRRAVRFNLWALVAAAALFSVLAVKAQITEKDPGPRSPPYETVR